MLGWISELIGGIATKSPKPDRLRAISLKEEGNALFVQQRLTEALICYQQALATDPGYSDAMWNIAVTSLFLGDYSVGFEYFETRFVAGNKTHAAHLQGVMKMMGDKPYWTGDLLDGKRLLVWTEQGFGDSIMFMRYLPMLCTRGAAKLIVACEAAIEGLVESLGCTDEIWNKDRPFSPDDFDMHCSLLSLPFLLNTKIGTIPTACPYVYPPSDSVRIWVKRLSEIARPRVGLVWAGGADLPEDTIRSLHLESFRPLIAINGISYVSLQKGAPAAQLLNFQGKLIDWMPECHSFADTAALISGLDLVISVDTAVAHLAGAMGKPIWLLNRYESEWRWMLERDDSPWYPSMRIFRQTSPRDWEGVIERVALELKCLKEASELS